MEPSESNVSTEQSLVSNHIRIRMWSKFSGLSHNRLVNSGIEIYVITSIRRGSLFVDDTPDGGLELYQNTGGSAQLGAWGQRRR